MRGMRSSRGIERIRAIALAERLFLFAPSFVHHLRMNGSGGFPPMIRLIGVARAPCDINGALEHHPTHHPARDIVSLFGQLPYSAILLLPVIAGEIRHSF